MLQRLFRYNRLAAKRLNVRFATSSKFDNEYEIDLVSLKKTPKKKPSPDINTLKQKVSSSDPLNPKENVDYLDFTEKYFNEINVFFHFVVDSYAGKIKSFDQLTPTEVTNSLYIFKNFYNNGKIPSVNKYNLASYNTMFGTLTRLLSKDHDFLSVLTESLMPTAQYKSISSKLYEAGFGNFRKELTSLSKEYDFNKVTSADISDQINHTLSKINRFLSTNAQYNSDFFKILIQINRYKTLDSLLTKNKDVSMQQLLTFLNTPQHVDAHLKSKQANLNRARLNDTLDKYSHELYLFNFAQNEQFHDFSEIAASLYVLNVIPGEMNDASSTLLRALLPYYGEGMFGIEDIDAITSKSFKTRVSVSDSLAENFEASALYHCDLHEYIEGIRVLKSSYKIDKLDEFSGQELVAKLRELAVDFEGNARIKSLLVHAASNLNSYAHIVSSFTFLDKLTTDSSLQSALINVPAADGVLDLKDITEKKPRKIFPLESKYGLRLKAFKQEFGNLSFGSFFPETISEVFVDYRLGKPPTGFDGELLSFLRTCNGETFRLDDLLAEVSEYKQIPNDLGIHDFVDELSLLRSFLQKPFSEATPEEILAVLDRSVEEILNGTGSSINKERGFEFMRLSKRLDKLFNLNGGHVEVLDTILKNKKVFEETEKKINNKATQSDEYVQIPDNLEIHKFSAELEALRSEDIKGPFANVTADEILSLLESRIEMLEASEGDAKEIGALIILGNQLNKLFQVNNGCTSALDTLLHVQEVFEKFESTKLKRPYKQVPNGFNLEEYVVELVQLRDTLQKNFSEVSVPTIFETLDTLIANQVSLEKKITFQKLSRNLHSLFKSNNNYTFILDNMILSCQQFVKTESDLAFKKMTSYDLAETLIGENSKLLKTSKGELESLFNYASENSIPVSALSASKFNDFLDDYKGQLERSYNYPQDLYFLNTLKQYNNSIANYPRFLQSLYSEGREDLSPKDVEQIYSNLVDELKSKDEAKEEISGSKLNDSVDGFKQRLTIPFDKFQTNKFDINEFREASGVQSDVESAKPMDYQSQDAEEKILDQYVAERSGDSYERPMDPWDLNKSSLEDLLKSSKEHKRSAKERRFRESLAYDWSKSMSDSNRSLESRNFFSPRHECSRPDKSREYLILTLDNEMVLVDRNPLGTKSSEDVFDILSKFHKKELSRVRKSMRRLQKRKWRLVGAMNKDGRKHLIWSRNPRRRGFCGRIKNVFATAGLVFLSLIGLNWVLEDFPEQKQVQEKVQVQEQEFEPESEPEVMPELEPKKTRSWFWSNK